MGTMRPEKRNQSTTPSTSIAAKMVQITIWRSLRRSAGSAAFGAIIGVRILGSGEHRNLTGALRGPLLKRRGEEVRARRGGRSGKERWARSEETISALLAHRSSPDRPSRVAHRR